MIENETVAAANRPMLGRRGLFGLAAAAAVLPAFAPRAFADAAPADAVAAIRAFNDALIASMKAGKAQDFNRRYAALAPVVDRTFDLQSVLAVSVGPRWNSLPADQQAKLLDAFRRYTVASYVANFNNFTGQSFTVSPDVRAAGTEQVVVSSKLVPASGDPVDFGYVMRQTPQGWRVVDVLADGSISRVATQRSDFRSLLARGGGDALIASLQRKAADLSGGALA
ncbi:MAG: ABC transporter substrate-binding protein [Proteobacteria bacterium]|nr:ABC transporter substrate-binding protein [Pseudomonadota bacterium]